VAAGHGAQVRVLFLEASTDPLSALRVESPEAPAVAGRRPVHLAAAIERERTLLDPVKADADVVIDTSALNVHELRRRMRTLFGGARTTATMQTTLLSFGYKNGLPLDADLVFDCRFLPNPHWVDELRPLTGLDEPVRDYVLSQPAAGPFLDHVDSLLTRCSRRMWPRARRT
jgi:UPF0042 nucleotide-binding protein